MTDLALQPNRNLQNVLYVRGGEIMRAGTFQRSFDSEWRRLVNSTQVVDDFSAARLYNTSVTAFVCINYRANQLSALPLLVERSDTGKPHDGFHPLAYFMRHSRVLLWHIEASLELWGVAYLRKHRNNAGYPTALSWLHKEDVTAIVNADDTVRYYVIDGRSVPVHEVIEIRAFDAKGNGDGSSKFDTVLHQITSEINIAKHASNYFFNSARPDGILVSKLENPTEEDMEKAKADWKQFQGAENAHRTFIASGEWEFIPLTAAPKDLAMIELKADVKRDIAMAFGVNPALIGGADVGDPLSANSTRKQIEQEHILNVTLPRAEMILGQLAAQWTWADFQPKNFYTLGVDKAEIDALDKLNADNMALSRNLLESGYGTYDEARHIVGLDPLDGYIDRPPGPLIELFNAGVLTINELRTMLCLDDWGSFGNMVKLNNLLIPRPQLVKYAQALVDQAVNPPPAQPSPFGNFLSVTDGGTLHVTSAHEELKALPAPVTDLEPLLPVQRAAPGITTDDVTLTNAVRLGAPIANHPSLKIAVRELDRRMDEATVEWVNPSDWTVELAISQGSVTPADAARLLPALQIGDLKRMDLEASAYVLDGNDLYIAFDGGDGWTVVTAALSLALSSLPTPVVLTETPRVKVGTLIAGEPFTDPSITGYPLILTAIQLWFNDHPVFNWKLRAISDEERRELRNWQTKAARGKGLPFRCEYLQNARVIRTVTAALYLGLDVDATFETVTAMLRDVPVEGEVDPPDAYTVYWSGFDALMTDIGDEWLFEYMPRAQRTLTARLTATGPDGLTDTDISEALDENIDGLIAGWVGSTDKPGPLTKLALAGLAAGTLSVINELPADYREPLRQIGVATDWQLMSEQAYQFALEYAGRLIRGINETTRQKVRDAIAAWIESGEDLRAFERTLEQLFGDRERARTIARTEASTVYNEGARTRWRDLGVTRARWHTVQDGRVCPICEPLDGLVFPFDAGWEHPGGEGDAAKHQGRTFKQPAHPKCRCFGRPDTSSLTEVIGEEPSTIERSAPAEPINWPEAFDTVRFAELFLTDGEVKERV